MIQAAVRGGITSNSVTASDSPTAAASSMPAMSAAAASDSPTDGGGSMVLAAVTVPHSAADVLLPRLLAAKAVRQDGSTADCIIAVCSLSVSLVVWTCSFDMLSCTVLPGLLEMCCSCT